MRIQLNDRNIDYKDIINASSLPSEDRRQLVLLFEKLVLKGHLGAAGSSRLEHYLGKLEGCPWRLEQQETLYHFLLVPGSPSKMAEVNQRVGPHSKTKLQIAINENSREKISEFLNNADLDINLTDKDGWSAAYQATQLEDPWALEQIIKKGAKINSKNRDGSTPLIRAADRNNVLALKVLLNANPQVDKSNDVGTALTYAIKKGHVEVVRLLLEAKADPNRPDTTGASPLALAKKYKHNEIALMLEKQGGEERVKKPQFTEGVDEALRTEAHYAAMENNTELLLALRSKGVDLDKPDKYLRTPLHYAAIQGSLEAVRLLRSDRSVNQGDKQGQTPLHFAAEYDHLAVLEVLDGDLNQTDNFGWTPLDKAAAFNSVSCCAYLCKKVDVNRKAPDGRTALDKAILNNSHECVEMLNRITASN